MGNQPVNKGKKKEVPHKQPTHNWQIKENPLGIGSSRVFEVIFKVLSQPKEVQTNGKPPVTMLKTNALLLGNVVQPIAPLLTKELQPNALASSIDGHATSTVTPHSGATHN